MKLDWLPFFRTKHIRFCEDCRWHTRKSGVPRCSCVEVAYTRVNRTESTSCHLARSTHGLCGRSGKHWKPKPDA